LNIAATGQWFNLYDRRSKYGDTDCHVKDGEGPDLDQGIPRARRLVEELNRELGNQQ
jgi:hypothetical protein